MTTTKETVLAKLNERIANEHAAEAAQAARLGRQPPAVPALLKPEQLEYPKWMHKGWKPSAKGGGHQEPAESRLIHSAEELKALGDGWSEEPLKTVKEPAPKK